MRYVFLATTMAALAGSASSAAEPASTAASTTKKLDVAAVVTEYRRNSHADVIVSRLFQGYGLDDRPPYPSLKLVSLWTDQVPANDISRPHAARYGFELYDHVRAALTCGGSKLAVDGVLLVAEHGDYPRSESGQTIYPKRRLFAEVIETFEASGRVVPVYIDKHLADNWADAKWIYDTARQWNVPLMAGSSLPTMWRDPQIDVPRGAKLEEIVAVSYGPLDAYGFHAVEIVQALAERRHGGVTGVKSVRCRVGADVWQAGKDGTYDPQLLEATLSRLKNPRIRPGRTLEESVRQPVLFTVDYRDGLRAHVFTLNGAVAEWAVAWRAADDDKIRSFVLGAQYERPYDHFSYLLKGVESMMQTGRPAWPVERTLLTSGILDACLISKTRGGTPVETPYLDITYESNWNWKQPPPPRTDQTTATKN